MCIDVVKAFINKFSQNTATGSKIVQTLFKAWPKIHVLSSFIDNTIILSETMIIYYLQGQQM